MNKKEMIKEMAKLCCWFENRKCTANPGIDDVCDMSCEYGQACEKLMSEGYRNCNDKVVLDRQEAQKYYAYKHIEPQIKGCLDRERELEKQLKQTRKETAKEFAGKLENGIDNLDIILHEDNDEQYVSINQLLKFIDEIAKQYGVEE